MQEYIGAGRFDWLAQEILQMATQKPQLWLAVSRAEHADRMRSARQAKRAKQRALDSHRRRLKLFKAKYSARRAAERYQMRRFHVRVIALGM